MGFSCGHTIDVNIKAYKEDSGFNQMTRASVKRFGEIFNLNEQDCSELSNIMVNKSKDTTQPLFSDSDIEYWKPFFENKSKELIKWGLSYKAAREILVLFNRDTFTMRIYPMVEILRNLKTDITFTKGGFDIGSCVSFQRKGGNGSLSKTIPKTSIKHPGNDIQLKLKINKLIDYMESHLLAKFSI